MADVQNLRERFHAIMLRDPRSILELCSDTGFTRDILNAFIKGTKKTSMKSLYRIEEWINKEEKRLGI